MENNSDTKYVTNWIIMGLFIFQIRYFGCNIAWSPASSIDVLIDVSESGQTEISDNTLVTLLISEYYIFRLQVTMHYSLLVHCFDTVK